MGAPTVRRSAKPLDVIVRVSVMELSVISVAQSVSRTGIHGPEPLQSKTGMPGQDAGGPRNRDAYYYSDRSTASTSCRIEGAVR